MGIFDFLKGNGREARRENELAEEIRVALRDGLRGDFHEPRVRFDDGVVTLFGTAETAAAREQAVLIAGNFKGVEQVNDDEVTLAPAADAAAPEAAPEPTFYTVQKGDTLSKIAEQHLGSANQWSALFEANRGVIDNPDLIYPGQTIRIPSR